MNEIFGHVRRYQATLQRVASVTLNRQARVVMIRPNEFPEELTEEDTIPVEIMVMLREGEEEGPDVEMAELLTEVMQNYPIEGLTNEIELTVNKVNRPGRGRNLS
jgi:hypothetical protein